MDTKVMVMAGGTGGHVFPALAVADELKQRGAAISWLGAPNSFESRTVPEHGYDLDLVHIQGLRGKGVLRWFTAPFKLIRAMVEAGIIIRRRHPSLVIGMGGFVSGPGGLVAKLLGVPLVIHEQNALPGMTNRWLAKVATRVMEAFPGSFRNSSGAVTTGNPVRQEILQRFTLPPQVKTKGTPFRLLIIGGSLGAKILNEIVPESMANIPVEIRPKVIHQAGRDKDVETIARYESVNVEAKVQPFLSDMADAYADADLVVCRAGALTIAELAAAGMPSILVPFPHAVDDHQTFNARYLSDAGAAVLLDQSSLDPDVLAKEVTRLLGDRELLLKMSQRAKKLALPDATKRVADVCEEVIANDR